MPDREKVIKTLEACMRDDNSCDGCPLYGADGWCESEEMVMVPKDYLKFAIATLKAQEQFLRWLAKLVAQEGGEGAECEIICRRLHEMGYVVKHEEDGTTYWIAVKRDD